MITTFKKISTYSIALLSFLFFTECKKQATDIADKRIIGSWNWIETSSDGAPSDSNPLTHIKSGISETLNLYHNYTFSDIKNGVMIDTGTFSLGHGVAVDNFYGNQGYDSLKCVGSTLVSCYYYTITNNDTLGFGSPPFFYGGGGKSWVRK